jgi:hypothetical protein
MFEFAPKPDGQNAEVMDKVLCPYYLVVCCALIV